MSEYTIDRNTNPTAFDEGIDLLQTLNAKLPSDALSSAIADFVAVGSFNADDYAAALDSNHNLAVNLADDFADVDTMGLAFFQEMGAYLVANFPDAVEQEGFAQIIETADQTDVAALRAVAIGAEELAKVRFVASQMPASGSVTEVFGEFNAKNLRNYQDIVWIDPLPEHCDENLGGFGAQQTCSVNVVLQDGSKRTVVFSAVNVPDGSDSSLPNENLKRDYWAFRLQVASTVPFDERAVFDKMKKFVSKMESVDAQNEHEMKVLLGVSFVAYSLSMGLNHLTGPHEMGLQAMLDDLRILLNSKNIIENRNAIASRLSRPQSIEQIMVLRGDDLEDLAKINARLSSSRNGLMTRAPLYASLGVLLFVVGNEGYKFYESIYPSPQRKLRQDISLLFTKGQTFETFHAHLAADAELREQVQMLWWALNKSGLLAELDI